MNMENKRIFTQNQTSNFLDSKKKVLDYLTTKTYIKLKMTKGKKSVFLNELRKLVRDAWLWYKIC